MKRLSLTLAVLLVVAGVPAPTMADSDDGRPLADAGLDQSATVGDTVYLDGGGSVDPDGEIVEYEWSIETPNGEIVTPADPDAVTTQFVPERTGRYRVRLTVTGDDGQTRSDWLWVDVEAAERSRSTPTRTEAPPSTTPTRTDTSETTSTPEPTPIPGSDSSTSPAPDPDPADGSHPSTDGNQPPTGEIQGPSSVRSGSAVSYTIDATDPDGEIVEHWWLPTSLAATPVSQSELRSGTRSIVVDGTPGTTATVSAIVVDDDGATATLTKTVTVRNTYPTARIEGDDVAVVNSTKQYRLVASDPDGEIVSVSLTSGADAVEPVGSVPWDGPTSSGEWARSFRFTDIPESDGTVTLEATVRDEHGGVTKVEKEVTVIEKTALETTNPVSQFSPEILSLDLSIRDGPDGMNGRQIVLSGVANDTDSERLQFEWRVDDRLLLSTTGSGSPARASVSHGLEAMEFEDGTVEVQLTVTDQNGHEESVTKRFDVHRTTPGSMTAGQANPIELTKIVGTTVYGKYKIDAAHAGKEVVISFGDGEVVTEVIEGTNYHHFQHRYATGGDYHLSINPAWSPDKASVPVRISETMYNVWVFERNTTEVLRTEAVESPGEDWTRDGIARIERDQVGVETRKTPASDRRGTISPGPGWERIGTTMEYHTERRTTRSTDHPGGDWQVAERDVGQRRVRTGWEYQAVSRRGASGPGWEYVKPVSRTVERSETEESADRPPGSGWTRGERVDRTVSGYETEWSDYRSFVPPSWEYQGSDKYVSGYDETRYCAEFSIGFFGSFCQQWETDRDPVYDYRYEYHVPQYDAVYEWERTVEETIYKYQYRKATYEEKTVHKYEKSVRVGTEYIRWEQPEYNRTKVYRWKKTTHSWEEFRSFSQPIGDVRDLRKITKECGAEPDADEPSICEEEA